VIDTIAFEPDRSGIGMNVRSSPGTNTVERLTLCADRTHLRYETTPRCAVLAARRCRFCYFLFAAT
jgi:hypothetical protein